jgi:TolA-binding protein
MATTNGSSGYGTPQRDGAMSMAQTTDTPLTQSPPDATGSGSGGGGGYLAATNGRKRKADGTSSRGVANLTPEQLAKKRANDREAQRAIRERTRNQIETLERRIKELESQQPFQELQNALRQREQVQAENDDLKRRMQTIFSLLQPVAASQGLNGSSSSVNPIQSGYS